MQVVDQYMNFISLEEDMFITRHQNTQELSYYGEGFQEVHDSLRFQAF